MQHLLPTGNADAVPFTCEGALPKPREQKPQQRPPPSPCSEVAEQMQAPLPLPPRAHRPAGKEGTGARCRLCLTLSRSRKNRPSSCGNPRLSQTTPGAAPCQGLYKLGLYPCPGFPVCGTGQQISGLANSWE